MNSQKRIRRTRDLSTLQRRLTPLVGEVCSRARLGYGDELKIDCGKMVPYHSAKLHGQVRGEWCLGSRGTFWVIEWDGKTTTSRSRRSSISDALEAVTGRIIKDVAVAYRQLALSIQLGDACRLVIEERQREATEDVLPMWELFTPRGECIQAGPGRRYSVSGSHKTGRLDR